MNKTKLFIVSAFALFATTFFASCSSDAPNEKSYYVKPEIKDFTYEDAILAYDSFVDEIYIEQRGVYRVAAGDASGAIAVGWCQSMMFDMAINAYKLTGDQKYLDLMHSHYLGCKEDFTFDWYDYSRWDLYDDMMWWVGSIARAYILTGDAEYLKVSEEGFKRVWYGKPVADGGHELDAKGSFDQVNGGMYWDWKFGRTGKMACINFPTIIAAMDLYKATGKVDYLNKAKEVYDWAIANLYNPENGAVADSKHDGNLTPAWHMLIYNQATCMGAAAMLYLETKEDKYLQVAVKAMEYIVNEKSTSNNILLPEGDPTQSAITDEKGIYLSILAQYYPFLVECGQTQFNDYIEKSINWGWHNRDKTRNLTNKYLEQVPSVGLLSSYSASGIPALMLTFPNVKDRK